MMKTKKMLAILTACAALTSSMAVQASAENTKDYSYKTVDYLLEKYYYNENLFWTEIEATGDGVIPYDIISPSSTCFSSAIYEDENGNPCTPKEAGWLAVGTRYSEYKYQYNSELPEYENCLKSGAFYYIVNENDTAEIIGADIAMLAEMGDTMEIPSEVDGFSVTAIGLHAFYKLKFDCPSVKKIVIPDTVTIIRAKAFEGALHWDSEPGSINIPKNIEFIGKAAYAGCGWATGEILTIPESVEFIGHGAFTDVKFWALDCPETPFFCINIGGADMLKYYAENVAEPQGEDESDQDYKKRICQEINKLTAPLSTIDGVDYVVAYDENCKGISKGIFESQYIAVTFDKTCSDSDYAICSESSIYLSGDLNKDKAVNIADLTMISRYVAEDADLSITANGKANADVNRDNEVNAMDINALAMKLAIE